MPGPKLKLGMPEVAKGIDGRHARERTGWRRTRLLAVKLVARGEATSAQIAEVCGVSRGRLFVWLNTLRKKGLEALLERGRPGPKKGTCRGVPTKVLEQLRAKLEANEFANAEQARRGLKKAHGIERPYASVWNWLKKLGGVLRVPRPAPLQEKAGSGAGVQGDAVRKARGARADAGKPRQGVGDG